MSFEENFEKILMELDLNDQKFFYNNREDALGGVFRKCYFRDLVNEEFIDIEDRISPLVKNIWDLTPWEERPCY